MPEPVTFVCADARLCEAASNEGLKTLNPLAPLPAFLTRVTVCVAPRRSIRQERAEKRIREYG